MAEEKKALRSSILSVAPKEKEPPKKCFLTSLRTDPKLLKAPKGGRPSKKTSFLIRRKKEKETCYEFFRQESPL